MLRAAGWKRNGVYYLITYVDSGRLTSTALMHARQRKKLRLRLMAQAGSSIAWRSLSGISGRLVDSKRAAIAGRAKQAKKNERKGRCKTGSAKDLLSDLNSWDH